MYRSLNAVNSKGLVDGLDFAGDDDSVNPEAEGDDSKDDDTDDQVVGFIDNLLGLLYS